MGARTIDEANRTATPLELLLDLTFVIAVAQLAARLAHVTADDHAPSAVAPFPMVFFAIRARPDERSIVARAAPVGVAMGVLLVAATVSAAVTANLTLPTRSRSWA
jgi:hypothetical protein